MRLAEVPQFRGEFGMQVDRGKDFDQRHVVPLREEVAQRLAFFLVLFRGRDPKSLACQHLEMRVQIRRDSTIGILKAGL